MGTFIIDWKNKIIKEERGYNKIENLKQEIYIALKTERFVYPIFDQQFGSEFHTVTHLDRQYAIAEIERMIIETVKSVDEVINVWDIQFDFDINNNKILEISFKVNTTRQYELDINLPLIEEEENV